MCADSPLVPADETLATLALAELTVPVELPTEVVAQLFHEDHKRRALVVLDRGLPVGLVERHDLLELFAHPYGRSLYGRKAIGQVMNNAPLMLDAGTSIAAASRRLTAGGEPELMQSFIITRDGYYLGLGRVRDLLARLTDLQLHYARHANPLTGLPGNVPLTQHIDAKLSARGDITVAYVDCNDFKPYNDVYGYAAGDRVIRDLGLLLERQAVAGRDFVGHVGGDDFIVVFESEDWEARCEAILAGFAALAPTYYTQRDGLQGGIWTCDRQNNPRFFPLLSIAIGVCQPDAVRCISHLDVATLSADAKHEAKRGGGNRLFISRRRGPHSATSSDPVASKADTPDTTA